MTLRGTVHGDMIKFDRPVGLPEGQQVTVNVEPTRSLTHAERIELLKRSFGGWADDPEGVDRFVEETYRLRGSPRDLGTSE